MNDGVVRRGGRQLGEVGAVNGGFLPPRSNRAVKMTAERELKALLIVNCKKIHQICLKRAEKSLKRLQNAQNCLNLLKFDQSFLKTKKIHSNLLTIPSKLFKFVQIYSKFPQNAKNPFKVAQISSKFPPNCSNSFKFAQFSSKR